MALVQLRDALARRGQQILVARHGFLGRVRPVREDGKPQVAVGVRQVVHFQPFHLLVDLAAIGQQRGNDHHGAERRRHTIAKLESWQSSGFHHGGHEAIHERYGQIRRRDDGEEAEHDENGWSHAGCPRGEEGQREQSQGEKADGTEIPEGGRRDIGTEEAARERGPAAEDIL